MIPLSRGINIYKIKGVFEDEKCAGLNVGLICTYVNGTTGDLITHCWCPHQQSIKNNYSYRW